jgi:hypothetical protein
MAHGSECAISSEYEPQITQMAQMNTPRAYWNTECEPQISPMTPMNAHFESIPACSSALRSFLLSGGSRS